MFDKKKKRDHDMTNLGDINGSDSEMEAEDNSDLPMTFNTSAKHTNNTTGGTRDERYVKHKSKKALKAFSESALDKTNLKARKANCVIQ